MKRSVGFVVLGLIVCGAAPAGAQTGAAFGFGPRVTFQRGEAAVPNSSALRLFGGQLKMRLSATTAVEVSADYESKRNDSLTERAKSMPIQGSVMYFPVRSVVSPYVLGGIGLYRHSLTSTPLTGPTTTASIREIGYHAGLGAELRLGRRMAIHGDYRYNHIRFRDASAKAKQETSSPSIVTAAATVISLMPKLTAIQESLKQSDHGSMWNWGLTFFF